MAWFFATTSIGGRTPTLSKWCVLFMGPQCQGIANTIVQLIRRSTSGVIAPLQIWPERDTNKKRLGALLARRGKTMSVIDRALEAAARVGFDAVVIDFPGSTLDQSVSRTNETAEAIKAINPTILAEGEVDDIGTGSEIHETVHNEDSAAGRRVREASREFPPETVQCSTDIRINALIDGAMSNSLTNFRETNDRRCARPLAKY